MVPVIAQGGVSATITVQINFYYLCVCSLTNVRVVLSDQTGRVVATVISPDGSQVLLVFRTQTPFIGWQHTHQDTGALHLRNHGQYTGVYSSQFRISVSR